IYINPIVAFLVAFLYFGDQASLLQVASYLVLLIAVVLFNWGNLSRLRKRPREDYGFPHPAYTNRVFERRRAFQSGCIEKGTVGFYLAGSASALPVPVHRQNPVL